MHFQNRWSPGKILQHSHNIWQMCMNKIWKWVPSFCSVSGMKRIGFSSKSSLGTRPGSTASIPKARGKVCSRNAHYHHCPQTLHSTSLWQGLAHPCVEIAHKNFVHFMEQRVTINSNSDCPFLQNYLKPAMQPTIAWKVQMKLQYNHAMLHCAQATFVSFYGLRNLSTSTLQSGSYAKCYYCVKCLLPVWTTEDDSPWAQVYQWCRGATHSTGVAVIATKSFFKGDTKKHVTHWNKCVSK